MTRTIHVVLIAITVIATSMLGFSLTKDISWEINPTARITVKQ